MKAFIKLTVLAALFSLICGCVGTYDTRLPPPSALNPVFLQYKELPANKVFVIAVDPTGQWAFGYDNNRATLEEAAQNAAVKCDQAREKFQVFSKAKLYAINDEVVYFKNLSDDKK